MIPKSSKKSSEVEFVDVSHSNFKPRPFAAEPRFEIRNEIRKSDISKAFILNEIRKNDISKFEIPNEIRKHDISKDFVDNPLTCKTSTNSTLLDFLKRAVPPNPQ